MAPQITDRLAAVWRGGGWARPLALRRLLAATLVLLAAALALRPEPGMATVLVAARDLAPGSTLTAEDVRPQALPAEIVPAGAITNPSGVDGHVLAGAARRGEPMTDVRLLGAELTRLLAPDEGSASVPVRLSDPDIAALLAPGSKVDVVTVGERGREPSVLAERATVLAVMDDAGAGAGRLGSGQRGRLVMVVLPRQAATQVAAASISQALTVTLR